MALLKANLGQKGCLEAVALLPQDWLKYLDVKECMHAEDETYVVKSDGYLSLCI